MSRSKYKILVVDDEQSILDLLKDLLTQEGYLVSTFVNPSDALEQINQETFSVVVSDLKMNELSGLEFIDQARRIDSNIIPIIMTGYGTLDTALSAIQANVYDYILKPFKTDQILSLIERALEQRRLKEENLKLRETLSLYNMSEVINQTLQVSTIIDLTLETTYSAVEADFVNMLMFSANKEDIVQVGQRTATKISIESLLSSKVIGRLLNFHKEKKPIVLDHDGCSQFFGRAICQQQKLHSFMSVPVYHHGNITGILNALNMEGSQRFSEGQRKTVALIANRTGSSLENAKLYSDLEATLHQTIEGLARAIEAKDPYTHGHSERVKAYATMIATEMSLSRHQIESIGKAALLHDIGKIGIDLTYINKTGHLTNEQEIHFRTHPEIGRDILAPIDSLKGLIPIVYHHHERFDGAGYPDQLTGEEIPLGARILAVADSYDAMTSDRAYRRALDHQSALSEIKECSGNQFDPAIVEIFIKIINNRVNNDLSPFVIAPARNKDRSSTN